MYLNNMLTYLKLYKRWVLIGNAILNVLNIVLKFRGKLLNYT